MSEFPASVARGAAALSQVLCSAPPGPQLRARRYAHHLEHPQASAEPLELDGETQQLEAEVALALAEAMAEDYL